MENRAPSSNERDPLKRRLLTGESEIDTRLLTRTDGDLALLGSERSDPNVQRVIAGRKTWYLKAAIVSRHREIRIAHDSDVSFHPRVNIAAHWNHDLGVRKLAGDRLRARLLSDIPAAASLRHDMNVVRGRVRCYDLQCLSDDNSQDVGFVDTSVLRERHLRSGHGGR